MNVMSIVIWYDLVGHWSGVGCIPAGRIGEYIFFGIMDTSVLYTGRNLFWYIYIYMDTSVNVDREDYYDVVDTPDRRRSWMCSRLRFCVINALRLLIGCFGWSLCSLALILDIWDVELLHDMLAYSCYCLMMK